MFVQLPWQIKHFESLTACVHPNEVLMGESGLLVHTMCVLWCAVYIFDTTHLIGRLKTSLSKPGGGNLALLFGKRTKGSHTHEQR